MNNKILIEEVTIPSIKEEDLLETIQQVQTIYKQRNDKFVSKKRSIFFRLLFHYGKVEFIFQCCLMLFMVIGIWITVQADDKTLAYAFYLCGSILLSICVSFEHLRSRIYQMFELENSCPFSPNAFLLWKVVLLSTISVCFIGLGAFLLAKIGQFDWFILLTGGSVPFLILTGCCVGISQKKEGLSILVMIYALVIGMSIVLPLYRFTWVMNWMMEYGRFAFVGSIFFFGWMLYQRNWQVSYD